MENVKIKVVVFEHPQPEVWGKYCGYCPETQNFQSRGNTIDEVLEVVKHHLYLDLCHRFKYTNLQNLGWEITENSIKVPIFADEEAVRLTERSYELKLDKFQILEIYVEVPPAKEFY